MKTRSVFALLVLALALPLFGGCIAVESHQPGRTNPTVGQQLIDLQKARDSGAMSETEYQQQRAKVLAKE
jgi:hypothetical protein